MWVWVVLGGWSGLAVLAEAQLADIGAGGVIQGRREGEPSSGAWA